MRQNSQLPVTHRTLRATIVLGGIVAAAIGLRSGEQTLSAADENKQTEDATKTALVNYTQALKKLAEADLAKAREANARVPDTIPAAIVAVLEKNVAQAEARVKAASGQTDGQENPYLAAAEDAVAFAKQNYEQAVNANARAAGAVSPGEVGRRKASLELAEARVEVAGQLTNASQSEILRFELLQLQEAIQELQNRVQLLEYRN